MLHRLARLAQVSRRLAADVEAATREATVLRQRASSGPHVSSKLDDVIAKRAELRQQLAESRAKEKELVDSVKQQPPASSHSSSDAQSDGANFSEATGDGRSGGSADSGGLAVAGVAIEESEREKLVRAGKITPFGTAPAGVCGPSRTSCY